MFVLERDSHLLVEEGGKIGMGYCRLYNSGIDVSRGGADDDGYIVAKTGSHTATIYG